MGKKCTKMSKKTHFFALFCQNIWSCQKKAVILQSVLCAFARE